MKENGIGRSIRAGAWGVLLGGAAGFALGVLLAPEEGQKIRRRLVYQLENLSDQVGQFVDQMLRPEAGNDARRRGDAVVADARERAERIRNDIDALLGEVRHSPEHSASTSS